MAKTLRTPAILSKMALSPTYATNHPAPKETALPSLQPIRNKSNIPVYRQCVSDQT